MKTIIEVRVQIEIAHKKTMPDEEIKELADRSVFVGGINGTSTRYGMYSTKEIVRNFAIGTNCADKQIKFK